MGWHQQRLGQLRRAAGLGSPLRRSNRIRYVVPRDEVPMPSFYVPGMRLPGDAESAYIDHRYFSPAARHWLQEVSRYRAQGGRLSVDDEECADRVLTAMMVGRKPSPTHERRFKQTRLLRYAHRMMPILLEREMRRRGYRYGPDHELPEGVKLPSAQQLFFKHAAAKLGTTPGAIKVAYYRWRAAAGTP